MAEAAEAPRFLRETLPPEAISDELAPTIAELGLTENCRQLAEEGWTVVENAATPAFNERLRNTILRLAGDGDGPRGGNMMLTKDSVFAEAALNPKVMAMAEFSVGRGHLLTQIATSVTPEGTPAIGLHADQNWLPAPFPAHNMVITACWATDEFTKAGGATLVVPHSHRLKRHPDDAEIAAREGAIAIECPPNSVAMWDGATWHANWGRKLPGERVVCHISYSRLAMRVIEDYAADADDLIEVHGERMAQLLGRCDSLDSPTGFVYEKVYETFNNAKI